MTTNPTRNPAHDAELASAIEELDDAINHGGDPTHWALQQSQAIAAVIGALIGDGEHIEGQLLFDVQRLTQTIEEGGAVARALARVRAARLKLDGAAVAPTPAFAVD